MELLPYVTTRGEYRIVDEGNPFRRGNDYFVDAGLDLKYRLTSNVTVTRHSIPISGRSR